MFDNELDKSLWIILESDEENRKDIIEFLRGMPEELHESIRDILFRGSLFDLKDKSMEERIFEGNKLVGDGTIYFYKIEFSYMEKSLEIKHSLSTPIDSETPYVDFSTELLLVNEEDAFPAKNGDEFWVGNFTHSCMIDTKNKFCSSVFNKKLTPYFTSKGDSTEVGYGSEHEYEYHLISNSSKHNVRKSLLRGKIENMDIDMTQMPDELSMSYIEQRYGEGPKIMKKNK